MASTNLNASLCCHRGSHTLLNSSARHPSSIRNPPHPHFSGTASWDRDTPDASPPSDPQPRETARWVVYMRDLTYRSHYLVEDLFPTSQYRSIAARRFPVAFPESDLISSIILHFLTSTTQLESMAYMTQTETWKIAGHLSTTNLDRNRSPVAAKIGQLDGALSSPGAVVERVLPGYPKPDLPPSSSTALTLEIGNRNENTEQVTRCLVGGLGSFSNGLRRSCRVPPLSPQ
ncbi:uncharacterized protein BDZ99DRAFT_474438 [Mytilinidion resinicola]|uniref:Uncharacterized protein n=1 Tax=Mytilinidion resinicola TaxID=574789 RepID=A0A6A6YV26_9PEZI|nr:uncharacterized protein BDZ99DRAFT_474438 [Mytilinidion resinicola]KAF2812233.1 hypothetical protein BDZ99DRAFT_474438 [Mytilinidion resinicola]